MTPGPPIFTVPLMPSTDKVISCVICGREDVDFEFQSRANGTRCFHGLHVKCAMTAGHVDNLPPQGGM